MPMCDGEAQTDDKDGVLARIFAWLSGKRSDDSNGFFNNFANQNKHELSFGKKKEDDEDIDVEVQSSGTFGGKKSPPDIEK